MIAKITEENIDHAFRLLKDFYKESPYGDNKFSEEKVLDSLYMVIDNEDAFAIMSHDNETYTGLIIAIKNEMPFSTETTTAELAWYVSPEYRKSRAGFELINTYFYWSKDVIKADYTFMTCLTKEVGKVYEKRGFKLAEQNYMKRNT